MRRSAPAAATPVTTVRTPAKERRERWVPPPIPGHVATNGRDCVTCHASAATTFTSWAGGKFTHAATDTNCSSCHNGTTATGHEDAAACSGDRNSVQQLPHQYGGELHDLYDGRDGHTAVSASRCDSCHNGSFTGEGTKGAIGTASYPGHVATNGKDCVTCHASAASAFASWAGGQVHPRGDRHQLLKLPQRHHRDRHEDAAAYSGDRSPVQQLPHQYGGELHDLYDGRDRVTRR